MQQWLATFEISSHAEILSGFLGVVRSARGRKSHVPNDPIRLVWSPTKLQAGRVAGAPRAARVGLCYWSWMISRYTTVRPPSGVNGITPPQYWPAACGDDVPDCGCVAVAAE